MTIKDVAELAGVSQSAVSRYLNGGSLSEEKRRLIHKTIKQTGYKPAVAAQMLRTGRQRQLGVLVPKIYSDAAAQIVGGMTNMAQDRGYSIVVCETWYDERRELECLDLMVNSGAAGLVVMGTSLSEGRLRAYRECGAPLVVTGQRIDGVDSVYSDDFSAAKELALRLLAKRNGPFAYIAVDDKDPQTGRARREGMLDACREMGIPEEEALIEYSIFGATGGYEAAKKLLEKNAKITGLLCATDTIAIGAMKALCERERVPGRDVGVAGIGGSWMDVYSLIPLTTADYSFQRCGEVAAKMLFERINAEDEGETLPSRHRKLDYTIIERESL